MQTFNEFKSRLSTLLRELFSNVRTLRPYEVNNYQGKRIVYGWHVQTEKGYGLLVLIDELFPYSHIHIAFSGEDRYLVWPHVEKNNYFCLPHKGWLPVEDLESSLKERRGLAIELIDSCEDYSYIEDESQKEFVSYWAREVAHDSFFSIINLNNKSKRLVCIGRSTSFWIVGDNEKKVLDWLGKHGTEEQIVIKQAFFAFLDSPPTLPLPKSSKQFFSWVEEQDEEFVSLINRGTRVGSSFLTVLAFTTDKGIGLIGAEFSGVPEKGFRLTSIKGNPKFKNSNKNLIAAVRQYSNFMPVSIKRADKAWVHGRGVNEQLGSLASSKVIILGCGSLGSHVASLLAQSGIGNIELVDPENLDSSNTGRHILGSASVDKNKALELEDYLCKKFPHSNIIGHNVSVQELVEKNPDFFMGGDFIVSCIAEPDVDLFFDSWYREHKIAAPIVYGWIGTQGSTGIALALDNTTPSLTCFIEPDGSFREPNVHFKDDNQIFIEPGCGTLFQPYGPLTANQVALLVSRLVIDLIVNESIKLPIERVYCCSTLDLKAVGGEWTKGHLIHRPDNYDGPFEYETGLTTCGVCLNCQQL